MENLRIREGEETSTSASTDGSNSVLNNIDEPVFTNKNNITDLCNESVEKSPTSTNTVNDKENNCGPLVVFQPSVSNPYISDDVLFNVLVGEAEKRDAHGISHFPGKVNDIVCEPWEDSNDDSDFDIGGGSVRSTRSNSSAHQLSLSDSNGECSDTSFINPIKAAQG
ncbi:hypothetical protein OROMI_001210 [Orobanche minor]